MPDLKTLRGVLFFEQICPQLQLLQPVESKTWVYCRLFICRVFFPKTVIIVVNKMRPSFLLTCSVFFLDFGSRHFSFAFFTPKINNKENVRFNSLKTDEALPKNVDDIFDSFAEFLTDAQTKIIAAIEAHESNADKVQFCSDAWTNDETSSRGLTRVIQPTKNEDCFIEKGAVSTTFLENGILSAERAKAIQGRRAKQVKSGEGDSFTPAEGDTYKAAALSLGRCLE